MLLLLACAKPEPATPVDLTRRLGPGEARAGFVTDEAALFGGISAEGRSGDVKIYNDRVQFVIQGLRPGNYYMEHPGMVVDADIVRPEGQLGRDMVDDWGTMAGVARMQEGTAVSLIDDGRISGSAIVRIDGEEMGLKLAEGAMEAPGFIPELGLAMRTDYVLQPESWFLEVYTTITATEGEATFAAGDLLMGSLDAAQLFLPGHGLGEVDQGEYAYQAFLGRRGEGAFGLFASPGGYVKLDATAQIISSLADMAVGVDDLVTLEEGESHTYTRLYGVGPDLATLASSWLELSGEATQTVEGVVEAPDGPVGGAWVGVLVDDEPWTIGVTDADGAYGFEVPEGDVELVISGRGRGLSADHATGWASYSAYAAEGVREAHLAALQQGAVEVPEAVGRGIAVDGMLGEPAVLSVSVTDGLPFEVQVFDSEGEDTVDTRVVPDRFKGSAAWGFARGGDIQLAIEPGTYDVLVHRGVRYEVHEEQVTLEAGDTIGVSAVLDEAYSLPDWTATDPHAHASPSQDGGCPMEDRIAVAAARGVQVHFGTDHDHVSDYRPLVEAMGLSDVMQSVVSDEMSPVVRGHVNVYPIEPDYELSNGGAWAWYEELVQTTEEQFEILRARHPESLFQLNHPVDSGVAEAANWSPGRIGNPDKWVEDFDAMEVLNSGSYDSYLPLYIDLTNRGYRPTPTGTSDTHGHVSGSPGFSMTFANVALSDWDNDALVDAWYRRAVVVSRGPFISTSLDPGAEVVGPQTLDVEALSPSWIVVDRLILLENGEAIETVEDTVASFTLDPDEDAVYIVLAEGDTSMAPVEGDTPWAMTSAIFLDVDGDGFEPPLPGFEYGP
ncbi:MAG TPA: CehA/McbA family metallohydrolase [Myxococcota bacterium]|nr:CehA/McbA family metallohydrolase [Myxococcota bacterium]